jgi:hypothetical protein
MAKSSRFMSNIGRGKPVSGQRAGMPSPKKRIRARDRFVSPRAEKIPEVVGKARKLKEKRPSYPKEAIGGAFKSVKFGDSELDGFDAEETRMLNELGLRFAEEERLGHRRPCLDDALPDYLKDPVSFIYNSSWRLSAMRTLKWTDVEEIDGEVRLRTSRLTGELREIIERAKLNRRPDVPFVFHIDGKRHGDFRKSNDWKAATKAAGLSAYPTWLQY